MQAGPTFGFVLDLRFFKQRADVGLRLAHELGQDLRSVDNLGLAPLQHLQDNNNKNDKGGKNDNDDKSRVLQGGNVLRNACNRTVQASPLAHLPNLASHQGLACARRAEEQDT